jgi:hypothetical protein
VAASAGAADQDMDTEPVIKTVMYGGGSQHTLSR